MVKIRVLNIIMFIIAIFSFAKLDVIAECKEYDVRALAERIKINYTLVEENYYYFDLIFSNLNKEIGVSSRDIPNFNITAFGEKTTHIEKVYGIDYIKKANFQIFALDQNCVPGIIKEVEVVLPRYNELVNTEYCKENPSKSGCQKLLYTSEVTSYAKVTKTPSSIKDQHSSKLENNNDNYEIEYYLVGGGLTLLVVVIVIFVYRKKIKEKKIL